MKIPIEIETVSESQWCVQVDLLEEETRAPEPAAEQERAGLTVEDLEGGDGRAGPASAAGRTVIPGMVDTPAGAGWGYGER